MGLAHSPPANSFVTALRRRTNGQAPAAGGAGSARNTRALDDGTAIRYVSRLRQMRRTASVDSPGDRVGAVKRTHGSGASIHGSAMSIQASVMLYQGSEDVIHGSRRSTQCSGEAIQASQRPTHAPAT